MNVEPVIAMAQTKMKKSVSTLQQKLSALRTGQASHQQCEHLPVECYGGIQPLHQIAHISVPETRQLLIKPWDVSLLSQIEKAIIKSDMSVNPQNDGKVIRITIPPLTDETRERSAKQARHLSEEARVSVRNIRREANEKLKKMEHDSVIGKDALSNAEEEIQTITDASVKDIHDITEKKECEIRNT